MRQQNLQERHDLSRYQHLVEELTTEEKISLVSGHGMWRTSAISRLDIPSVVMSDGPNGLRYSPGQADQARAGADFGDFISMVNERRTKAVAVRETEPATCFPTASLMGATWNPELAEEQGQAMARECALFGVSVLLGPGMNLRRTPLAGRTSEYYSEDPVLTANMASAVVRGLQSRGVAACIKHFVANNSEVERTSMDSVIEPRALHDVYLRAFELIIAEANPWMVMSSYNRVGGINVAHNRQLLTDVLRTQWGYDGTVVSDWHGITDRPASLVAGNDLDMPQSRNRIATLRHAIETGRVSDDQLDASVQRILVLLDRLETANEATGGTSADARDIFAANHDTAHRAAVEGSVLLKNDGVLPLSSSQPPRMVVLGEGATEPVIQGFGSARMSPVHLDIPLEELQARAGAQNVTYLPGVERRDSEVTVQRQEIGAALDGADVAVIFAHTLQSGSGENADRRDLSLDTGYDELIATVSNSGIPTVVILTVPDAVTMPWLNQVNAVLIPFYAGQAMGGAVADLIFGGVEPSGKLPTTFPQQVEDVPGYLTYPGEAGSHLYSEGPYIGYRSYHVRDISPLFPFGFGLSYTTFEISDLEVISSEIAPGGVVRLEVTVKNTGTRSGAEVVQVYSSAPWAHRPEAIQLVGHRKIRLSGGEERRVEIVVPASRFSLWDVRRHRRILPPGPVQVRVGSSSTDLPLSTEVSTRATVPAWRPLRRDTEPMAVLENPLARSAVSGFIAGKLAMETSEAETVLQECARSFVNVFDTIANRFDLVLDESEVELLIAEVERQEACEYPAVQV